MRAAVLAGLAGSPAGNRLLTSRAWAQGSGNHVGAGSLQTYYESILTMAARRRREERAAVSTPAQVMQLRDRVREKALRCYGPLPERTPLNVRITAVVNRDDYTIENLLYDSRPGYPVTANLYRPKNRTGRLPAVLATCGHSANGKAYAMYQAFARNLARMGFVTLIYDPPAQGERMEFPALEGQPGIRGGTYAHNHWGNLMALTGERFSAWEAWDGIRGIDYLLSREDVDPQRIGVTGNSGGGTQTSHITCLDDRISMAAPSCFVTTFLYNLRNELPTDAEQVIPGWIAAGLDMADFFIARIPRPTILIGQEKDFFDVRGLRETYAELKRLYTILGREEDLQLHIGPGGHGFHPDGRRAMYEFFAAVAGTGEALAEPDTPAEPDPLLHAAPNGDILQAAKVTTAGLIAGKALELQKSREPLTGAALRAAVMRLLALDDYDQSTVPGYKTLTTTPGGTGNSWNSSLVKSEAGAVCLLHHRGPAPGSNSGKVSLLIPHESAAVEIPSVPEAAVSGRLFALDTRGTASLYKKIAGDRGDAFFQYYGGDYMYANHGLLLDRPLAGRRTLDILKSIDLLLSQGAEEVTLIGRGTGSVPALFAAFLHPAVKSLIQLSYLESFHSLTQDDRYQWPFSAMVPGILQHFDLPDLYRETALEKNVELVRKMSTREMRIV